MNLLSVGISSAAVCFGAVLVIAEGSTDLRAGHWGVMLGVAGVTCGPHSKKKKAFQSIIFCTLVAPLKAKGPSWTPCL